MQLFVGEDRAPEDRKRNDAKSKFKTYVGHKPDNGIVLWNDDDRYTNNLCSTRMQYV